MRILFYAINHVGLGHVARLSVMQRFITDNRLADCHFFSESRHAAAFFSCPGVLIEGEHAAGTDRWRLLEAGMRRAMEQVRPDILVCDTYWSEAAACIPALHRRGGRAVLMLRMTDSRLMSLRLREAITTFDSILLPHHPREIRAAYRNQPELLRRLDSPQVVPIGPVCRTSDRRSNRREVIFSVGAGGEWPGASRANTIDTFLGAFQGASRLLLEHGHPRPTLAAGTFLRVTPELKSHFVIRQTTALHEHFGPRTIIVTRGGYNTTWEAISARSPIVLCGSRNRLDDVKARSAFVQREGLGRSVAPDGEALFNAIVTPWQRRSPAVERWSDVVNTGLRMAADEMLGGTFLRARERVRGYPASNGPASMSVPTKRLIARFEEVDASRPSAAVCSAARLALALGFDARLCLVNGAGKAVSVRLRALEKSGARLLQEDDMDTSRVDCVGTLVWPGPRVRNELRISEEITERQRRGVNTGLGIHADRMPVFLVEYLLRAFALYNR
jgi:predicted glycosyltransferase